MFLNYIGTVLAERLRLRREQRCFGVCMTRVGLQPEHNIRRGGLVVLRYDAGVAVPVLKVMWVVWGV